MQQIFLLQTAWIDLLHSKYNTIRLIPYARAVC